MPTLVLSPAEVRTLLPMDACIDLMAEALTTLGREPACPFGTASPTTASPDMEVSDALHLMLNSGLTVLPVVEDDRLSGMVLRVDLMQAMLLDMATGGKEA